MRAFAARYIDAETLVEMATLRGTRTLFMDGESASLEVGKAADCIIMDWERVELAPGWDRRRSIGSLVWSGGSGLIDSVVVAGRRLLASGRSTISSEETVVREAERALSQVAAEVELDALLPPREPGSTYRGWRYL